MAALISLAGNGCTDAPPADAAPPDASASPGPKPLEQEIIRLLRMPADDPERAQTLHPKVETLCRSSAERAALSSRLQLDDGTLRASEQRELVEHVASVCMRRFPERTEAWLKQLADRFPGAPELLVLRARLLAASGQLKAAQAVAVAAIAKGSVPARILALQIELRRHGATGAPPPRERLTAWRSALEAPPPVGITTIDFAALLAAQARLLAETAFWWSAPEALTTATALHERLLRLDVPGPMRARSLDFGCAHAPDPATQARFCAQSASHEASIGAAHRLAIRPEGLDERRARALSAFRQQLAAGDARQGPNLMVLRGDRAELLEWSLALAELLPTLPGPTHVLSLSEPDATAVGRHLGARAQSTHEEPMPAPWVLNCFAAKIAEKVRDCALPSDWRRLASRLRRAARVFVVGRHVDTVLEAFDDTGVTLALLSFRTPRRAKPPGVWLKSLADVGIIRGVPRGELAALHRDRLKDAAAERGGPSETAL